MCATGCWLNLVDADDLGGRSEPQQGTHKSEGSKSLLAKIFAKPNSGSADAARDVAAAPASAGGQRKTGSPLAKSPAKRAATPSPRKRGLSDSEGSCVTVRGEGVSNFDRTFSKLDQTFIKLHQTSLKPSQTVGVKSSLRSNFYVYKQVEATVPLLGLLAVAFRSACCQW